ncbi:MAG: 50S ribosomal protein P1 [archaeon]
MEYVYAAMLLHKAGTELNEANVKKVLEAASVKVDDGRVKALLAALDGVDIDAACKEVIAAPVAQAAVSSEAAPAKEEKKEEKKDEGAAAAGLGALFG